MALRARMSMFFRMNVSNSVFSSKILLSIWQSRKRRMNRWYVKTPLFSSPLNEVREDWEVCNCEINQHTAFTSIAEFVQTCPGPLAPRMLDCCLVSLLLQPLTHPEGLSCDPVVVLFGDKCFIVRLRDFVTKMNSVNIMEGKCVKCCYSQTLIKRPPSGKWTMAT